MSKRSVATMAAVMLLIIAVITGVYALTRGVARMATPAVGVDAGIEMTDPLTADPVAAAQSTIGAMFSWNPAEQESPQSAAAAIADRLTGDLYAYARSGIPDAVLPKMWPVWAAEGDTVQGVGIPVEQASIPDAAEQAVVEVTVRQMVRHRDGEFTPYHEGLVAVSVEKIDGLWKAADYEYISVNY